MTERPAPREGRRSALTVAGVFLLIAAWQVYRRHEMPAIVDGTIGGLLVLVALGGLLAVAGGSALAPFIYTIF